MKKVLSALAVSLLATSAFAAEDLTNSGQVSGLVNLSSEVFQTTCKLAQGSDVINVAIDKTPAELLVDAGSVSPRVADFQVNLLSCPKVYVDGVGERKTLATLKFTAATDATTANGNLKNTATGATAATNVQFQLLNKASEVINLKTSEHAPTSKLAGSADGRHTLELKARLTSEEGLAGVGKVSAQLPFTISYK